MCRTEQLYPWICLPVNGETKKEEDSGNETQPSELHEEEDQETYDPDKSFFDNISCESTGGYVFYLISVVKPYCVHLCMECVSSF